MLRGGIQSESPMEQLARRTLDPQIALNNGRPTLIEFYADWCQVCREMAPSMLELERSTRDRLDVVLVNVDNPRWQDLVDRYDVNGIPQLNLFNAEGEPRGRSLGLRNLEELELLSTALLENQPLPSLPGVGSISRLQPPSSRGKRTGWNNEQADGRTTQPWLTRLAMITTTRLVTLPWTAFGSI